jgi:hypothetical protein
MLNDRDFIESYITKFLWSNKLSTAWNFSIPAYYISFVLSIFLTLLSLFVVFPWWLGLIILPCLPILTYLFILFRPVKLFEFTSKLDDDLSANQTLIVLYEMILKGNTENLYYNILKDRIFNTFKTITPKSIYKTRISRKFLTAASLVSLAFMFSIYAGFFHLPEKYELVSDNIAEAAKLIAVREDLEEKFSTEIDRMYQLKDKLDNDKESSKVIEETLGDLHREITEQLSSLRRESLSSLIEEKKINPELGKNLNKLLEEKMSLDDSREFILDLLSDDSISPNQRSYIQKSYEDFSTNQEDGKSSDLAEALIDELDQDISDKTDAIEGAIDSINEALEQLKSMPKTDIEKAEANGQTGNVAAYDKENRDVRDGIDTDNNSSSISPGSEKNTANMTDDFKPFETNDIQAHLPEGQIIIDGDTGILRLESDEELQLERIEGIYTTASFEEGIIRNYAIPENMKYLVKEYFTILGGVKVEE